MAAPQLGQQGMRRLEAGVIVELANQGRRVLAEPVGAGPPCLDPEQVAVQPEAFCSRPGGRPGGPPGAGRGDSRRARPGQRSGQVERPAEPQADRAVGHASER